mgnify:CR=1 FL=1
MYEILDTLTPLELGLLLLICIVLIPFAILHDRKELKKINKIFKSKGLVIEKLKPPYTFKNKIHIPSRKFLNKGTLAFPIKSESNKSLLIFKWSIGREPGIVDHTWVFSYKIQDKPLPLFTLNPKNFFLNFKKSAIHVNESFDEKYLLEIPGKCDEDDEKKIIDIFKNINLQNFILSNYPISIECNGVEVFYYRKDDNSELDLVPEILDDISELHNKMIEINRVI